MAQLPVSGPGSGIGCQPCHRHARLRIRRRGPQLSPKGQQREVRSQSQAQPWQGGRKGSLCPPDLKEEVQDLLAGSVLVEGKRWATREGRAYCAQPHADDVWHGYPVGWKEVPARLRREWQRRGIIKRRDVSRYWEGEP